LRGVGTIGNALFLAAGELSRRVPQAVAPAHQP
jgi:hypothetical protein